MPDQPQAPAYLYPYKPGSYSDDEAGHVAAHLENLQSFTFTYDGGKLKVWHDGARLVYAQQTAKVRGFNPARLWLTSRPEDGLNKRDRHTIGPDTYLITPYMPTKYAPAFMMLIESWRVNPSPAHLYAAIGIKIHCCALCGKGLTTPESTQRGVGPECIQKIGGRMAQAAVIEVVAEAAKNPNVIII